MFGAYIIAGVVALASFLVGNRLKSKFAQYSEMPTSSGMSGKEIAEQMLRDSGITDVQVISTPGQLTDHYNPVNKTVNLSEVVYNERNVSAAAVAAHEVGHAVQHATAYRWLTMRSKMVPAVKISSNLSNWIIMIGLGMAFSGGNTTILLVGICLLAVATLFSVITLPVEYDASNRALAWLEGANITRGEEHEGAKDALKWAARTYLVAAIGAVANLMYFVMRYMQARN